MAEATGQIIYRVRVKRIEQCGIKVTHGQRCPGNWRGCETFKYFVITLRGTLYSFDLSCCRRLSKSPEVCSVTLLAVFQLQTSRLAPIVA